AIYASRFDAYAGEQLQVLGQQKIKHGNLIKTQIIKANGEPVAINYVVHDNDVAWQIRDIYLSGAISELATHRSEFATILRTSGIDGLIDSLNKKATDLQVGGSRGQRDAPQRCRWHRGSGAARRCSRDRAASSARVCGRSDDTGRLGRLRRRVAGHR